MSDDGTEPGEDRVPLEVYEQLEKATPEQRTDIVLSLIEKDPEGRLVLPRRDGVRANLREVDLSPETLKARLTQLNVNSARWWYANLECANSAIFRRLCTMSAKPVITVSASDRRCLAPPWAGTARIFS
jgi:hypothetical protein